MVAEIGANSVSAIARKYHIAPSLLFRWKRELGAAVRLHPVQASSHSFALRCRLRSRAAKAHRCLDGSR